MSVITLNSLGLLGSLSPFTVWRHLRPSPPYRSYAQAKQDICVASIYNRTRNGYYIDLASNDAISISNTYLLDRVLGWQGICIEPQSIYSNGYRKHRTCALVSSIVSPNSTVEFVDGNGGLAGIYGFDNNYNNTKHNIIRQHTSETADLRQIFQRTNVPPVIDYMSLDIEGYELSAMQTFPFDAHSIKVMTVERPGQTLHHMLVKRGMCISHNSAKWTDLLYVNRTLWEVPFVRPQACAHLQTLPNYVKRMEMC